MLKKHSTLILLIVTPLLLISSFGTIKSLNRDRSSREMSMAIVKAHNDSESFTDDRLSRMQDFVKRLKAIDQSQASPEVKFALGEYIAAIEQSIQAIEAHHDSAVLDKVCSEKAAKLSSALKR